MFHAAATRLSCAAAILALLSVHYVSAECECRNIDIVDPWTSANVFNLVCTVGDDGMVLSVSDAEPAEKPEIDFWVRDTEARNGTLVAWQYKVGDSDPMFLHIYWNSVHQLYDPSEHIPYILDGLYDNQNILFRFHPLPGYSDLVGPTRVLARCSYARRAVKQFLPKYEEAQARYDSLEEG